MKKFKMLDAKKVKELLAGKKEKEKKQVIIKLIDELYQVLQSVKFVKSFIEIENDILILQDMKEDQR